MNDIALAQRTYEPDVGEPQKLAAVHDLLAARDAAGVEAVAPRYFLSGAGVGDQVEIPANLHAILIQAVEALMQGVAVTIAPQSKILTTQQAADLLNISRPTLIRLLDAGELPYERSGSSHRKLRLKDVIDYGRARREQQYAALEAMSGDLDETMSLDEQLEASKRARKAVAERRRKASARS